MPDLQNIRLPAGWYPDPSGADHRRWWDGTIWTTHTAPFQRPAPVYDVDDLAEKHARDSSVAAPPRRIRTAARLGRSLAALAHRLPLSLGGPLEPDESQKPAADAPAPAAPQPTTRKEAKTAANKVVGPRASGAKPPAKTGSAAAAKAKPPAKAKPAAKAKSPAKAPAKPKAPAKANGRHVQ